MRKWHKLSEFLEITGIELWCGYVWTTLMICVIWKCFVDVFEHECLVFGELFGKKMVFMKIDKLCQNEILWSDNLQIALYSW